MVDPVEEAFDELERNYPLGKRDAYEITGIGINQSLTTGESYLVISLTEERRPEWDLPDNCRGFRVEYEVGRIELLQGEEAERRREAAADKAFENFWKNIF